MGQKQSDCVICVVEPLSNRIISVVEYAPIMHISINIKKVIIADELIIILIYTSVVIFYITTIT